MQANSIAECSEGSILQFFRQFVIKTLVLPIFEWPFYTGLLYANNHHRKLKLKCNFQFFNYDEVYFRGKNRQRNVTGYNKTKAFIDAYLICLCSCYSNQLLFPLQAL